MFLLNGQNPFDLTIYKNIINSKYTTVDEIYKKFEELNKKYSEDINLVQNLEILKIS